MGSAVRRPVRPAPTVAPTGGGASGGQLAPGVYRVRCNETAGTITTGFSWESAPFTVASGNLPRVTFPPLRPGHTARNLYATLPRTKFYGRTFLDSLPRCPTVVEAVRDPASIPIRSSTADADGFDWAMGEQAGPPKPETPAA